MSALRPQGTPAALLLSDGAMFPGYSFGYEPKSIAEGCVGEVVFNTAMSGYQEILTDPSYYGQIVVMTYPHIGNYGFTKEDNESRGAFAAGFIVHECSDMYSNWRGQTSLTEYLKKNKIPALCDVDTRAVTRHIREKGAMNAYIVAPAPKDAATAKVLLAKLQKEPSIGARDLVYEVSCKEPYEWTEGNDQYNSAWHIPKTKLKKDGSLIVVLDMGVKSNMLRGLVARGAKVKVVPSRTSAEKILAMKPAGVLLSNGPGDPERVEAVPDTIRALLGKVPMFGICMGHQVLAHALGAKTYKMKFGHHGANQPVLDVESGQVMISSQNHNYSVDPNTLPDYAKVAQVNLNDQSVEGIELPEHKAFSVQYHPEACPGPRDSMIHFDQFIRMINEYA